MNKKILIISLISLLAFLLSACAGGAGVANSWPGISVDGDTIYLADNLQVYAVNLADGSEKWRFPAEANQNTSFYAAPTITPDGQLVVGGYNKVLYSLNPTNGQENWTFAESQNRYIGSSLTHEAGIFAPSADNSLYALDLKGKLRWTFTAEDPLWARPATDPDCTCIYIPSMDHHIYSIDAVTGKQNWKSEDLGGSVVGTPALSPDGVLYAGSFGSQVVAIDAKSGKIIWRTPTAGWVWAGPVLHEDRLYFGDLEGKFYAIDAKSGNILWEVQPDGPVTDTAAIADDRVYFTTESGTLYALDLDGSTVWNKTFQLENGKPAKIYAAPVVSGDRILVAPMNPNQALVALGLDGNQVWSFTPQKK